MNIVEYSKLSLNGKEEMLKHHSLLLESYTDKEAIIYIYYMNGFFIEVTVKEGRVVDYLPFQRGFCTRKNNIYPLRRDKVIGNTEVSQ